MERTNFFQAIGDGARLLFVAAFGGDSDSAGSITDTNNISRFSATNISSFVGVVGGGGGSGGDGSSGTTIPLILGSPEILSPGSLCLEGLFRARHWVAAL